MSEILAGNLVHFVRYLRARGLSVVPQTATELADAAQSVGLDNRDDVYHAFRALTVVRPADREAFDEAFALFFGTDAVATRPFADEIEFDVRIPDRATLVVPVLRSAAQGDEPEGREDVMEQAAASPAERLASKDFGDLTPEERAEVRQLIASMVWRPADARGRRAMPSRRGPRPDLRRTLRKMVSHEGELMPLARADRRPRRRPLIVLADVSGSMDRFVEMFLYFIHAARGRLGRVEAFVFSTRLTRITRELRHPDPSVALRRVGAAVDDWSGGTLIGEALHTFNWAWSRRVTRGGAIALVMSDGWDCGDPKLLGDEMARFARSMYRVVWLNPLAGRPGFSPETRGLRTVLPHVDDFLSVANLEDLRALVRLLESLPARRMGVRPT